MGKYDLWYEWREVGLKVCEEGKKKKEEEIKEVEELVGRLSGNGCK